MHLLFKDGYFNYPSSPFFAHNYDMLRHCNYGFVRRFDAPENEIHLRVIKRRNDLYTSDLWKEFALEFPSAMLLQIPNDDYLIIPDVFDCIKFKFMLVN